MFDIARIRAVVQAHADETSIRAAADEIGLSFTGLRGFLAGGSPQPRTREKLVEWYIHHRSRAHGTDTVDVTEEDANAAISLLATYIEAGGRAGLSDRRRRTVSQRLFGSG